MNGEFLSGGLVFAVGAVLWVAYLIPSWLRRRHFNETEANTVRLQHTVSAMTAVGLDSSHLRKAEASARAAHEQKKALRRAERAGRKMARTSAQDTLSPEQRSLMAKHRRRSQRQVAAVILLTSVATLAAGIAYIVYVGDMLIAALGAVATLVTLVVMSALSRPAKVSTSLPLRQPATVFDQGSQPTVATRAWTPQTLPRPLQQSPGSASAAVLAAQQASDARRRAIAEQAYLSRVSTSRRAELVEASTRDTLAEPVEAASQPASRFAGLGIVEDTDTGTFDLDSALKRRRVG